MSKRRGRKALCQKGSNQARSHQVIFFLLLYSRKTVRENTCRLIDLAFRLRYNFLAWRWISLNNLHFDQDKMLCNLKWPGVPLERNALSGHRVLSHFKKGLSLVKSGNVICISNSENPLLLVYSVCGNETHKTDPDQASKLSIDRTTGMRPRGHNSRSERLLLLRDAKAYTVVH